MYKELKCNHHYYKTDGVICMLGLGVTKIKIMQVRNS